MTATEQLIAKQVADVFPASVDDLPLQDAARRGLIAPLAVPPRATRRRDQLRADRRRRLRRARAGRSARPQGAEPGGCVLYRDRFDDTPGIVYAAGVDHAYNLAQEFRATGLQAEAVSGRTPPVRLAETLAAYERGEINVLINAMLLAEGLELAARDDRHAPRSDRQPPRLPAAHRPHHADAHISAGKAKSLAWPLRQAPPWT